jgi:hypothetical protein
MNNVQLAIFLEKYQVLLSTALDIVKDQLPEELAVKSKNIIFGNTVESFPILDPLYQISDLMEEDVELLKKDSFEKPVNAS